MKHAVWERNVDEDADGIGRLGGMRADFIGHLFMMGFSIAELADGCADGFMTTEMVEDAIRYVGRKRRRPTSASPAGPK